MNGAVGFRPEFEAPVFPPITPDPAATRLGWETSLRQWLTSFLDSSGAPGANPSLLLAANFKRQYRFIGLIDGERYEVQVVEPDIKDPKLRYHEQSNRFAYTETLNGGCVLLHAAGQNFGFQGLYVIPQIVNPAALSKAAPDTWHIPAKGAGTDAKDILAFLVSYADFDTVREGGAKKVSATDTEMMISCERGISFYLDAADILGLNGAVAFVLSGNGCQVHVALDRLPHTEDVQRVREEFVHVVDVLYSGHGVVGDDTVCNPNRLCPAAGTLKRKGFNDIKLGRVHRLTGIYCSEKVERLDLGRFHHLVDALRDRLTDEQREVLAGKTKGARVGAASRSTTTRTSAAAVPSKGAGPSPYELANAVPIREVYLKLGQDPGHPRCPDPACGADDTTNFIDEALGVQSLKCFHQTCGERSWKSIDLVVVLKLGKSLDDQDARRDAVRWITEQFPERGIPKLTKSKAAAKADVDALVAATPSYFDDVFAKCSSASTDDELRPVVEAIQTRDAAPATALLKALTKATGTCKTDLLKLAKLSDGTTAPPAVPGYSDAEWPTKLKRSPKGAVLSTFANAVTALAHDPHWAGKLAWCEFTSRIVLLTAAPWPAESAPPGHFEPGSPWGEADDHRLVDYLERHYGVGVNPKQAYFAALLRAEKRRVHPVRDYLSSITWDGTRSASAPGSRATSGPRTRRTPEESARGRSCRRSSASTSPDARPTTCPCSKESRGSRSRRRSRPSARAARGYPTRCPPIGSKDAMVVRAGGSWSWPKP